MTLLISQLILVAHFLLESDLFVKLVLLGLLLGLVMVAHIM